MEPVIHNGWLRKKGEGSLPFQRRWNRYWFLLRGPLLSWFTSPESTTEIGNIFLHQSIIIVRKHEKYEAYFEINSSAPKLSGFSNTSSTSSNSLQLRLLAPSIAALIEWLTIFERAYNRGIITNFSIDKGYLNTRTDIRQLASPLASPPIRRTRGLSISDNNEGLSSLSKDPLAMIHTTTPTNNTKNNGTITTSTTTVPSQNSNRTQLKDNQENEGMNKGKKYTADSHRSNGIHGDRHIPQIIQHNDPSNIQNSVVINDDDIAEDMRIAQSVLNSGGLMKKKDLFQKHYTIDNSLPSTTPTDNLSIDSRRSSYRSTATVTNNSTTTNKLSTNETLLPSVNNNNNNNNEDDVDKPMFPILLLSRSNSNSRVSDNQFLSKDSDDYNLVVSPLPSSSNSNPTSIRSGTENKGAAMNESFLLRQQETSALDMTLPSPTLALRTTNVPLMPSLEETEETTPMIDGHTEKVEKDTVVTDKNNDDQTDNTYYNNNNNGTKTNDEEEDEELPSDYPLGQDVHAMGLPPTVKSIKSETETPLPAVPPPKLEPSLSTFISPQIRKRGKIRFESRGNRTQLRTIPSTDVSDTSITNAIVSSPPSYTIFSPSSSSVFSPAIVIPEPQPVITESFVNIAVEQPEEEKEEEESTEDRNPILQTAPRTMGTAAVDQSLYAHQDYPLISPVLQLHDATSTAIVFSPVASTTPPVTLQFTELMVESVNPINANEEEHHTLDNNKDNASVPSLYESDTDSIGIPHMIKIYPIVIQPIVTHIEPLPIFTDENGTDMNILSPKNSNNEEEEEEEDDDDVLNEALSPFADLEEETDNIENLSVPSTLGNETTPFHTVISPSTQDNLASPTKELFKAVIPNESIRTVTDGNDKSVTSPVSSLLSVTEGEPLSPTALVISKADNTTSLSLNLSPPQNSIYMNDDTVQSSTLSSSLLSPEVVHKYGNNDSSTFPDTADTPTLEKPTINPSELSFEEHLDALFDQSTENDKVDASPPSKVNTQESVTSVSSTISVASPEPVSASVNTNKTVRITSPESIVSEPVRRTDETSTKAIHIRTPVSTGTVVPFSYALKTPFDDDIDLDSTDNNINYNNIIVPSTPFDDMVSPSPKRTATAVISSDTPNIVNVSSLNPFDSPLLTMNNTKEKISVLESIETTTNIPVFPSLENAGVPVVPVNTLVASPTKPTISIVANVPSVTVPIVPVPSIVETDPVKKLQELLEITRYRVEALADRVRTEETDMTNTDLDTSTMIAVANASVVMDEAINTVTHVAKTPLILPPNIPLLPSAAADSNDDIETVEMVLVVDSDALFDATPDFVLPSPNLPFNNTLSPFPSPISTSKRVKRGKGTPGNKVRDDSLIDYPSSVNNTIDSSLYSTNLDRLFADTDTVPLEQVPKKETTTTTFMPTEPSVSPPVPLSTSVAVDPVSVSILASSSSSPIITMKEFLEWGEGNSVPSSEGSPTTASQMPVPVSIVPLSPPFKSQLPLTSMESPLSPSIRSQLPDEATVQAAHDAFSSDLNNWLKQFEQRLQSSFAKVNDNNNDTDSKSLFSSNTNNPSNVSTESKPIKSQRSSSVTKIPDAGPAFKLNGSKGMDNSVSNGTKGHSNSQPSSRRSSTTGSIVSQKSNGSNRNNISSVLDKSSGPLTSSNLNISHGSNVVTRGRTTDSRRSSHVSQSSHNLPRSRSSSTSVYSSHRSRSNSLTRSELENGPSSIVQKSIPSAVPHSKVSSKSAGPAPEMMKPTKGSSASSSVVNVPGIRLANSRSRIQSRNNSKSQHSSVTLRSQSVGPRRSVQTTNPSKLSVSAVPPKDPMEDLMQSHANHLRRMLSRVKISDNPVLKTNSNGPVPSNPTTLGLGGSSNVNDPKDQDEEEENDGQLSWYPSAASKLSSVPIRSNENSNPVIGKRILYDNNEMENKSYSSGIHGAGPVRRGTGTRLLTSPVTHNPWKGGVW